MGRHGEDPQDPKTQCLSMETSSHLLLPLWHNLGFASAASHHLHWCQPHTGLPGRESPVPWLCWRCSVKCCFLSCSLLLHGRPEASGIELHPCIQVCTCSKTHPHVRPGSRSWRFRWQVMAGGGTPAQGCIRSKKVF